MTIHREGRYILIPLIIILLILNFGIKYLFEIHPFITLFIGVASLGIFLFFLQFFRSPKRSPEYNENHVLSPADGKVVVIEEVYEDEYFKDKRLLVSIFMSPFNVHINWVPFSGILKYYKYHKGKFLFAWEPKSSTENERNTIVIQRDNNKEVLMRQVAGIVARRIVFFKKQGDNVKQADQIGFIKFGSRVDLYFPLGTKLNVKLDDKVKGQKSVIATF